MTGLLISANWKGNSYDPILAIVHRLMKIADYELVKVTINILDQAKVIINMVVCHYGVPELIVTD